MGRIKWITNGVSFRRGNYEPLIARFDNTRCWLSYNACTTASGFRAVIRKLADEYGAKMVEIKYLYDEDDNVTEDDIKGFLDLPGRFVFRNELKVPSGTERKFIDYNLADIFTNVT